MFVEGWQLFWRPGCSNPSTACVLAVCAILCTHVSSMDWTETVLQSAPEDTCLFRCNNQAHAKYCMDRMYVGPSEARNCNRESIRFRSKSFFVTGTWAPLCRLIILSFERQPRTTNSNLFLSIRALCLCNCYFQMLAECCLAHVQLIQ